MTDPIFTENAKHNIRVSAHYTFGCHAYTTGVRHDPPERQRKRERVTATVDKGLEVLASKNPPQSREEAIRAIVGVVVMALAAIFPQYRLAIQVAGWLWDYLHGPGESGATQS
jgi:hypothetical protein